MKRLFRANLWWNTNVPQVLGWIYFCLSLDEFQTADFSWTAEHILPTFSFIVTLISISAFGYLFNDWCDIQSDLSAGKQNQLSTLNPWLRALLVLLPLIIGLFFWIPQSKFANALLILQVIALISYSLPPFRLKNRGVSGVIADAFYGHVNPIFITLFFFDANNNLSQYYFYIFIGFLFAASFLKGIRNILLHQLDDRKLDRVSNTKTFVYKYGALFTQFFINNMLPYELFFTILTTIIIAYKFPPFIFCLLIFGAITYLKFSGWKISYLPYRQGIFRYRYFLNEFYELWAPLFFLLILISVQPKFTPVFILHLIIFPKFALQLWKDAKTIRENFKTEDDY